MDNVKEELDEHFDPADMFRSLDTDVPREPNGRKQRPGKVGVDPKRRPIIKTYIKEVREKLGITAYELSRISGVHAGNLHNYEKGNMNVSLGQLMKLSEALGVYIDVLIYGDLESIDEKISKELIELRLLKKNMQRLLEE